jgi:hypothetical protein
MFLKDVGLPEGEEEADTVGGREPGMSVVVRRKECVGAWESIQGNVHCQAVLFYNCQSIPGMFSLVARTRGVASFNRTSIFFIDIFVILKR